MKLSFVRYLIAICLSMTAIFMYVDRACLAVVIGDIKFQLNLSDVERDWVLAAFFWSYALFQVPAGLVGNRFGFRLALAAMLFAWSAATLGTGLAWGFLALLSMRLLVGITEAGAYPNSAAIIKNWFPVTSRGMGNSIVAFGGRLGWAVSFFCTPLLLVLFTHLFSKENSWRAVLIFYGALGMVWALVMYLLVTNTPQNHWLTSEKEKELTREQNAQSTVPSNAMLDFFQSFGVLIVNRNMWLAGLTQFGTNMAWAFLITKLPDYLREVHSQDPEKGGKFFASMPPAASCIAMFIGGFIANYSLRRYGPRWGRSLPICTMLLGAAMCYLTCFIVSGMNLEPVYFVWIIMSCLALGAAFNDFAVPSVWAFAQDVGGKKAGPALGWGNMLGNIGAGCSPLIMGFVQRQFGWSAVFLTCGISFAIASGIALLFNATKPIPWKEDAQGR